MAEPAVQYSSWFTEVIVVIVLVMTYNSIPYSSKSIKLPMVVTKLNNRLSARFSYVFGVIFMFLCAAFTSPKIEKYEERVLMSQLL